MSKLTHSENRGALAAIAGHAAAALLIVLMLVGAAGAVAGIEVVEFSEPQLRERYQGLIAELRCPKCQNQNLADSNSPISIDLRNEVRKLLEQGLSDGEIKQQLVARYSEFILYRPAVNANTALLWGLPPALLLLGAMVLVLLPRRSQPRPAAAESADLQQRVEALLQQHSEEQQR